jgi:hypothetical protein
MIGLRGGSAALDRFAVTERSAAPDCRLETA